MVDTSHDPTITALLTEIRIPPMFGKSWVVSSVDARPGMYYYVVRTNGDIVRKTVALWGWWTWCTVLFRAGTSVRDGWQDDFIASMHAYKHYLCGAPTPTPSSKTPMVDTSKDPEIVACMQAVRARLDHAADVSIIPSNMVRGPLYVTYANGDLAIQTNDLRVAVVDCAVVVFRDGTSLYDGWQEDFLASAEAKLAELGTFETYSAKRAVTTREAITGVLQRLYAPEPPQDHDQITTMEESLRELHRRRSQYPSGETAPSTTPPPLLRVVYRPAGVALTGADLDAVYLVGPVPQTVDEQTQLAERLHGIRNAPLGPPLVISVQALTDPDGGLQALLDDPSLAPRGILREAAYFQWRTIQAHATQDDPRL